MVIDDLKILIEKHTGKPVLDKRNTDDSYNNNTYIIHITFIDTLRSCIYGYLVYSGNPEVMAVDLQSIPDFVLLDNINIMNNYFSDDKICNQNFRYNFDKANITKATFKVADIV